jgi:cytochrome c-type biogenesis protein CcmH/NrfG
VKPVRTLVTRFLLDRGKAMMARKRYGDAATCFERATQLAPQNMAAWLCLGEVRDKQAQSHGQSSGF